MKNIQFGFLVFLLCAAYFQACDACKLQQPKITQNLTHDTGPGSNWDWIIVIIITVITLATLFYSFKFLIKPGEKNTEHIKNTILDF